jgi:tight adherence protein C
MFVIYIIMLALYGLLFILSGKEKLTSDPSSVRAKIIFLRSAEYLLRRSGHIMGILQLHRKSPYFAQRDTSIRKQLNLLEPSVPADVQMHELKVNKISQVLILLFAGILLALMTYAVQAGEKTIEEGGRISRNVYGGGNRQVELTASVEGTDESLQYSVNEREYTDCELDKMFEKLESALPQMICGDNKGPERITGDLRLIRSAEGYPFGISWESDDYAVIDSDGKVSNDPPDTDETVMLTAVCTYRKKQWISSFPVHVYPREFTEKQKLEMELKKALSGADAKDINKGYMELPDKAGDKTVVWSENRDTGYLILPLMVMISALLVPLSADISIDRKVKERQRQLLTDYPELVSKVTLYMSAGMSLRNVFFRMAEEYQIKRGRGGRVSFLYEEIRLTCNELKSGIQESQAYEKFSKRCVLKQYMRFGTLISQNLKKGSNDLLSVLRKEAEESLEERRNHARECGEEAGTKLLLPMMMMLTVVMVIIIMPAFMSFTD